VGGHVTRGLKDDEKAAGYKTLINGDDRTFSNHFFVGINFTFFLPPSIELSP